jgi:hypothetical protein
MEYLIDEETRWSGGRKRQREREREINTWTTTFYYDGVEWRPPKNNIQIPLVRISPKNLKSLYLINSNSESRNSTTRNNLK